MPSSCRSVALALLVCALAPARGRAQADALPPVTVYSPAVANQVPAGTFAMPVSALRFEPLADIQPRNMAEAQADVTLRGDTFESTGMILGDIAVSDPQTGHYLTELPVSPSMLGSPRVLTGADHALESFNATGGSIAYGWRPIQNAGFANVSAGTDALLRAETYAGGKLASDPRLRADADVAHSEGNGTVDFGDFRFDRSCARLQWDGQDSRADLFAGYQASVFGWPNLYTPFNSDESENIQTVLVLGDARLDLGGGDTASVAGFYRRNKDDYAYNRFAPLGPVHPYQHTTWEYGASAGGHWQRGMLSLDARAEATTDALRSTSLVFGPYHDRTMERVTLLPRASWDEGDGALAVAAGAGWDASDRAASAVLPVVEVERTWRSGALRRLYASTSGTSQLASYTALDSSPAGGLFRGNPSLGRSVSRDTEAGMSGSVLGLDVQSDVFYRRDANLVDWTYLNGVFGRSANPVNIGTTGVEVVARRSWDRLSLVFGYTALGKTSDYEGAAVTASFYALNYARQRLTAALVAALPGNLELRWDNAARIQAPDALRTQGGSSAVVSAVGLDWRPGGSRTLDLSVQVDNLWNSAYQSVPSVPASRRQLSFGATLGW
jgi:vitamin B12 transporter